MTPRILMWGSYDPDYASNKHVVLGLQRLAEKGEIKLKVINRPLLKVRNDNASLGLLKLLVKLTAVYLYLIPAAIYATITFRPHTVFVGYLGHLDMLAFGWWFRVWRKKLVFLPLISLYNGMVEDRQKFKSGIIKKAIYLVDYLAFHLATRLIWDTKAHARYIAEKFKLNSNKLSVLYIGEVPLIEQKPEKSDEKFKILFIGKYHPFYRIEKYVEAIELIKINKPELYANLEIVSYGVGQVSDKIKAMVKDKGLDVFEFHDWVNYQQDKDRLALFDLGIGVFGDNAKGMMVIPNKIYLYSTLSLPTLTLTTPAVEELFSDNKNIYLIETPTPEVIAAKLQEILSDPAHNRAIGAAAFELIKTTIGVDSYYPSELEKIIHEAKS